MWETSHIRRSLQWDCVNSKKWTNGDARLTENDEINVVTCYAEDMRYVYVAQSPSHKDSPSLHVLGNLGVAFAEGHCFSFAVVNEDLLELTLGTLLIHPVWEQQAPDKQRAWRPEESKRRIKKKQRVTVIQSRGDRVAIKCSGIIKTNGIRQLRPQLIYWVVSDTCFMSIHSCYMFDENRELSDLRLIVTSLCNSRQVMHRIEACNPEVNSYSQ